ncbi:MAG: hypothetical protein V3U76_20585 [Granulosicoccus sp.]
MTAYRILRITLLFSSVMLGVVLAGCSVFSSRTDPVNQESLPSNASTPSAAIRQNMYGTLESNYSTLFDEYDNILETTLVFENDSMRLGHENKTVINEYAAQMNPDTDVLSVIGCSHGKTLINNGNSLLALGRASRVKEAFLFAGLKHDRILEEGCWAPQLFDAMPSRGVVLTLKRKKS